MHSPDPGTWTRARGPGRSCGKFTFHLRHRCSVYVQYMFHRACSIYVPYVFHLCPIHVPSMFHLWSIYRSLMFLRPRPWAPEPGPLPPPSPPTSPYPPTHQPHQQWPRARRLGPGNINETEGDILKHKWYMHEAYM